jgi:hypothetical protein
VAFQWKIVRINGNGSIRLIYNGTCPSNNCTINNTGSNTQIGTSKFNINNNDAKYLGYMYGGEPGVASTKRNATGEDNSKAATYNETDSSIKGVLDTWYENNISGESFESDVADNLFCNDRQLANDPGVGGANIGSGYGNLGVDTFYAVYYRLNTTKILP